MVYWFAATSCDVSKTSTATTPCTTLTTGGNGNGAPCVFPYLYRGDLYYSCITANNNGIPWCATLYDYDTYRIWGNCAGKRIFRILRLVYQPSKALKLFCIRANVESIL